MLRALLLATVLALAAAAAPAAAEPALPCDPAAPAACAPPAVHCLSVPCLVTCVEAALSLTFICPAS